MRCYITERMSNVIKIYIFIFVLLCILSALYSIPCYGSEKAYVSDVVIRDAGNGYDELDYGFDGTDGSKVYTVPIPDNSLALKMKITATSFSDDDIFYSLDFGDGSSVPQHISSGETVTTDKLNELYGSNFRLGDQKNCTLRVGKYDNENDVWDDQAEYRFTFIRQVVLNSITAYDGDEKRTITPGYIEPGFDSYSIVLPKEQDVLLLKPSLQIKDAVRESSDTELKVYKKLVRYDLPDEAVSKTDNGDEILVDELPEKDGEKYIPFTVYYSNERAQVGTTDYCFYLDTGSYVYPVDHEIKSAVIEGDGTRICSKGDSVELKVITDVEENAELTYQWYRDSYMEGRITSSAIVGATSDRYMAETDYSRCDDYYCKVTNHAGGETHSKTTDKVHLTVDLSYLSAPTFIVEAEDQNVNLGDSISLTCRGQCQDIDVTDNNKTIKCTYKWFASNTSDCSNAVEITDESLFPYGDNHSRIDFIGDKPGYSYYYCVCSCSCNGWTESVRSRIIAVYVKDTSAGIENLEGSGELDDPYLIKDISDLKLVFDLVKGGFSFRNSFLSIQNDIDLPADWIPIGTLIDGREESEKGVNIRPFSGNLDGNNHTVTIAEGGKPLFGYVREASVKNLNIYGSKISGYGLVDNYVVDYGTDGNSDTGVPATCNIENVTILSGSSILKSGFIGGVGSGANTVNISNCTIQNGVTVGYDKTESNIGSFAGEFNGNITNSSSAAAVFGVDNVGGLVGRKGQSMGLCTVTNSSFTGTISASGSRIGGIIGSGYGSESAPNTPVVVINNCFVTADITGNDEVGGVLGSEPIVEKCWGNGTGGVQNSFYYGKITATGSNAGGIIGYYNSLDKYQTIANNFYLNTSGVAKGIGKLNKIITAAEDSQFGRDDDFDADRACSAMSAEAFVDGTVLDKLNAGEGSYENWIQGEEYPEFAKTAVPVELKVSRYIEEYLIGDDFDTFGMEITVNYSDGSIKSLKPSEVHFSGFDSKTVGQKTITATYGPISTTFEVSVVYDEPPEILVRLILIGDTVHEGTSEVHTLKGGGLKKWLDKNIIINMNMSVYDLLVKGLEELGVEHRASYSAQYGSNYVSGIQVPGSDEYLEEFTNGSLSGWMYHVNGYYPDVGVSRYYPDDGDVIVFHYTDDYTQEAGIGADGAGFGEDLEFYPPKDDPEEEERKKLDQAKAEAKAALSNHKDLSDYRAAEQEEIGRIIASGRSAIDAAETEEAVKALLTEYKGKIDQLKTIAQYEAEEELARKAKAATIKKAKAVRTTVSVKALTKHRAKVTWKKVTLSYTVDGKTYTRAVTGYKVYRAAKKNGKYKLIKTIKKAGTLKYTDRKLKKGRKYYYKVRTYTKIDGKTYLGKWSKAKSVRAK